MRGTDLLSDAEHKALREIAASLSATAGVDKVVFYGSRCRGDFSDDSDMDIFVVVEDVSIRKKVISLLYEIEMRNDVPVSPIVYTRREYEFNKKLGSRFIENVEREGNVLYDAHSRT